MGLEDKSIHELRALAVSLKVPDVFALDKNALAVQIKNARQAVEFEETPPQPPVFVEAARTETASPLLVVKALEPYIKRGLKVNMTTDHWQMTKGSRTDEGTMRMPIIDVVRCAARLFE